MPCRGAALKSCPAQQYWDALVCRCMPCSLACGRAAAPRCAALCEAAACARRAGFYYDELLKRCISCSAVCGQHPKQCAPACEATAPAPAGSAAGPEARACAEQEPWLVLYVLLGLCLCALLCSLALGWSHLRRKGDAGSCQAGAGPCHRRDDSAKDRLVEAGSVAEGSPGCRVPEETCGFCFPERGPAAPGRPPYRGGSLRAGACSTDGDGGRFKIICSPAQEKAPLA